MAECAGHADTEWPDEARIADRIRRVLVLDLQPPLQRLVVEVRIGKQPKAHHAARQTVDLRRRNTRIVRLSVGIPGGGSRKDAAIGSRAAIRRRLRGCGAGAIQTQRHAHVFAAPLANFFVRGLVETKSKHPFDDVVGLVERRPHLRFVDQACALEPAVAILALGRFGIAPGCYGFVNFLGVEQLEKIENAKSPAEPVPESLVSPGPHHPCVAAQHFADVLSDVFAVLVVLFVDPHAPETLRTLARQTDRVELFDRSRYLLVHELIDRRVELIDRAILASFRRPQHGDRVHVGEVVVDICGVVIFVRGFLRADPFLFCPQHRFIVASVVRGERNAAGR